MSTPRIELTAVTIDCSDAGRLADFYARLTGGKVTYRDDESGHAQTTVDNTTINFQRVNSYSPPQWPGQEHPQQFHLDFRVDNLDAAVAHAVAAGATESVEQPAPGQHTVLLDLDGHPFCLTPSKG